MQRGVNRMVIFHEEQDHLSFLAFLEAASHRSGVAVHAFVLMKNHVHCIATPGSASGLPRMMKEIGTRYVRYYNRKYDRIGTLWNGRYKGILIQDERYWITCLRYVEQNPVRAGIVDRPADYPWSSYKAHAFGQGPAWLTSHDVYKSLGADAEARQLAYRQLCGAPLPDDELTAIRCAPLCGVVADAKPCLTPI
jgi:putative transposase